MSPNSNHVVEFVDDYLHGLLSQLDAAYVQTHCENCPICSVALAEARKRLDLLRSVPRVVPSDELVRRTVQAVRDRAARRRSWERLVWGVFGSAMAAAILIVAAIHTYYANLSA